VKGRLSVLLALSGVYLIWGSTYLGMRLAIQAMPPLLMAGVRYLVAGTVMLAGLRLLRQPLPSLRQWRHAGGIGVLMLLGGNGAVCLALEQGIGSGLSALVLAVTPLFALLMAHFFWRQRATGREWLGIALGIAGMVFLDSGRELQATPLAGVLLIFAALSWSLGSIWGKHLDLPPAFMASAVQMIAGGLALLLAAAVRGEALHGWPPAQALWALAYLIFIGAILGFSSYAWLLANVRPALATSYAYVNPLVAVLLGLWLGGEQMDRREFWAMGVILAGVVLVCLPAAPAANRQA
jgi:drug/metabolite transporter (DMT)-like permease